MDRIFLNGFPDFTTSVEDGLRTIPYETFNFSGGEVHIKIKGTKQSTAITIFARANNSEDIMRIVMCNDALMRMEYEKIYLFMPYVPYARQDRVMVDGEPFSLKVFANLINSCGFNKVIVFDCHSEISSVLINNCYGITNDSFIDRVIYKFIGDVTWCAPDSGAFKKIFKLADNLKFTGDIITCNKARDLGSGKIKSFKVDCEDLNGKSILILDDICSRGGTFIGIAKALKKKNAGNIYLAISHYEGVADISELETCGIKKVFTTDSMGKISERKNFYGKYVEEIAFEKFIDFDLKPFV